jgi:hypothetical protein
VDGQLGGGVVNHIVEPSHAFQCAKRFGFQVLKRFLCR